MRATDGNRSTRLFAIVASPLDEGIRIEFGGRFVRAFFAEEIQRLRGVPRSGPAPAPKPTPEHEAWLAITHCVDSPLWLQDRADNIEKGGGFAPNPTVAAILRTIADQLALVKS